MTIRIGGQIESRSYPNYVDHGEFSTEEYGRRYELVAKLMRDRDVSGIVFYGARGPGDVHYLSNWIPTREAYLLWPRRGDPLLLVQLFNHVPQARQMAVVDDVRFGGSNDRGAVDSSGELLDAICEKGLDGRLGIAGPIPYRSYQRLKDGLGGTEFVDVSSDMRDIRTIRSPEEFDRIGRAASLSDEAIRALAEQAAPGITELDLGRIVDEAQAVNGGYTTLRHIMSTPMEDPHACVPAKYLSNRRLQEGDVFVVELSAGWLGYSGQILRTFSVGREPTKQFQRLHQVALTAYQAAKSTMRDGALVDELLEAVDVIHQEGFTICDDLLHGANQFPPILRTRQTSHGIPSGMKFKAGMAVVLQPNVVTKDWSAGVQYGQMLRLTQDGVEDLHEGPDEIIVCGAV